MNALPEAPAPGFHTYLHHSELELAEGIVETTMAQSSSVPASLRFQPDPNRIILSGASMGGIGTFRMGALDPLIPRDRP